MLKFDAFEIFDLSALSFEMFMVSVQSRPVISWIIGEDIMFSPGRDRPDPC